MEMFDIFQIIDLIFIFLHFLFRFQIKIICHCHRYQKFNIRQKVKNYIIVKAFLLIFILGCCGI